MQQTILEIAWSPSFLNQLLYKFVLDYHSIYRTKNKGEYSSGTEPRFR